MLSLHTDYETMEKREKNMQDRLAKAIDAKIIVKEDRLIVQTLLLKNVSQYNQLLDGST